MINHHGRVIDFNEHGGGVMIDRLFVVNVPPRYCRRKYKRTAHTTHAEFQTSRTVPHFPRKKYPKFIAYVAQHPWSPADQRREDKMIANRWRIVRNRMTAARIGCGGCEGLEWTVLKRALYAFQGYIAAVEAIRRREEENEIVLGGLEDFEILWAVREKLRDAETSRSGEGGVVA